MRKYYRHYIKGYEENRFWIVMFSEECVRMMREIRICCELEVCLLLFKFLSWFPVDIRFQNLNTIPFVSPSFQNTSPHYHWIDFY